MSIVSKAGSRDGSTVTAQTLPTLRLAVSTWLNPLGVLKCSMEASNVSVLRRWGGLCPSHAVFAHDSWGYVGQRHSIAHSLCLLTPYESVITSRQHLTKVWLNAIDCMPGQTFSKYWHRGFTVVHILILFLHISTAVLAFLASINNQLSQAFYHNIYNKLK